MEKELKMQIPGELAGALSRRHSGRPDITRDEILDSISKMTTLWSRYEKAKAKLEYCENTWWDEKRIEEGQFSNPRRFSYAHTKRRKLIAQVKDLHQQMFYLLVHTDGNYEPFGQDAMYAEDVYSDFMSKYRKLL